MQPDRFQAPRLTTLDGWAASSTAVTLQVTVTDARRIVRALEETSVSLGGSPSGAQLAGSYIRLASTIRQQAQAITSTDPEPSRAAHG